MPAALFGTNGSGKAGLILRSEVSLARSSRSLSEAIESGAVRVSEPGLQVATLNVNWLFLEIVTVSV